MDFEIEQKAESLRKEIKEFARAELPEDWATGMFEEESKDEDWAFAMSISKKLAQRGWLTMKDKDPLNIIITGVGSWRIMAGAAGGWRPNAIETTTSGSPVPCYG